jgi:exoribonuclease R
MREIVGVYLHRELTQALGHAPADDDALREAVVERANHARQLQKRVTNACNLLVLDQVFGDQLSESSPTSPLWASVVGLSSSKVHVTLENPSIDAKIQLADLRRHWGQSTKVTRDLCEVCVDGQRRLRLGDRVRLIVVDHDVTRKHWQLAIATPN